MQYFSSIINKYTYHLCKPSKLHTEYHILRISLMTVITFIQYHKRENPLFLIIFASYYQITPSNEYKTKLQIDL